MRRIFCLKKILYVLCVTLSLQYVGQAHALTIIRDTEIENALYEWAEPLRAQTNVPKDQLRIILVSSPEVNAFVMGGSNIFLYTGLIMEAESAGEVVGVIAHELGHIQGGHLFKMRQAMERASYESMLATLLGIGVAAITGDGRAASTISIGGNSTALRGFLSHSRMHESSADQAALRYLEGAGLPPEGLLSFMEKMAGQEMLSGARQSEYLRTHPLTYDRVDAMRAGLEQSPHRGKNLPEGWEQQFNRMKAKIAAYEDPSRASGAYDVRSKNFTDQYAWSIIDYRRSYFDSALSRLDDLLQQEPNNPYLHEFRGQILLEDGRFDKAQDSFQTALRLDKDAALIRVLYAQSLIGGAGAAKSGQAKMLQQAIDELIRAKQDEPRSISLHRMLATAYGRMNKTGLAQLALAEEAVLLGRKEEARRLAQKAISIFENEGKRGSGDWLKAQDILQYISNN